MRITTQAEMGANPQTTRQNFITAAIAKAGNIEAVEDKYGISESIIESWIDGTEREVIIDLTDEIDDPEIDDDMKDHIRKNIGLIKQSFKALNQAYIRWEDI